LSSTRPPDHGRIETRKIWTTSVLNGYLDFPHVGQAFAIERDTSEKKSGKQSHEVAYGIASRPKQQADRSACTHRPNIRQAGHGPENVTRLRRFAVGAIKSKGVSNVAQKMRQLNKNMRSVFDYLRMTKNSCAHRDG